MNIGTAVRVVKHIDNYPTVVVHPNQTGILTCIDEEGCWWVRLDNHFPELDEWENEVAIWDYSDEFPDMHPSNYLENL
tara:strand:+ start:204 stop:437 length:234 start_codon:yes stop_codon:yes gene_type:complete